MLFAPVFQLFQITGRRYYRSCPALIWFGYHGGDLACRLRFYCPIKRLKTPTFAIGKYLIISTAIAVWKWGVYRSGNRGTEALLDAHLSANAHPAISPAV